MPLKSCLRAINLITKKIQKALNEMKIQTENFSQQDLNSFGFMCVNETSKNQVCEMAKSHQLYLKKQIEKLIRDLQK